MISLIDLASLQSSHLTDEIVQVAARLIAHRDACVSCRGVAHNCSAGVQCRRKDEEEGQRLPFTLDESVAVLCRQCLLFCHRECYGNWERRCVKCTSST